MKIALRTSLAMAALALAANAVDAKIPLDYYSSMQGLSGAELKTAIHNIISGEKVHTLSYGSGKGYSWWGLYVLDRNEDNSVIDRYSDETFYFFERGSSIEGMDIEHAMPKSWWKPEGQTTDWVLKNTDGAKDLHQLMPAETKINISKSDNPIGIVKVPSRDNGVTKVGTNAKGRKVWEPADKWKGDFARVYMYMATAYQDYEWTSEEAKYNMVQGDYPTLNDDTSAILLDWARNDQVSDLEVRRANRVQTIQNNRNPYVDFPNLMEYVWGDSIDTPLDLYTTVKSDEFYGFVVDPEEEPEVLYANDLLGDDGGFTIENISEVNGVNSVWSNDEKYGWMAHGGYGNNANNHNCYKNDSKLVSPVLNLRWYRNANFSFKYHINDYKDEEVSGIRLLVRHPDGSESDISDRFSWQTNSAWAITHFKPSCDICLNDFVGERIQLVIHYTSTDEQAYRCGFQNFKVIGSSYIKHDGVLPVFDEDTTNYPIEYFTIDGRRIANPEGTGFRGLLIRRQGTKVDKIIIR